MSTNVHRKKCARIIILATGCNSQKLHFTQISLKNRIKKKIFGIFI